MKALPTIGILILGCLVGGWDPVRGQAPYGDARRPLRLHGSADWEYFDSQGDLGGSENQFTQFRQKYSLDMIGFLWDPRFNQFSIGFDFFLDDRDSNGTNLDQDGLGYRLQSGFFLNRPFPLNIYARNHSSDSTGINLASSDRETSAYGFEWTLKARAWDKLRLQFDRSSYDLTSPLLLQERRRNGSVDFLKNFRSSDLTFRYHLFDLEERVSGTRTNRDTVMLIDRTRFRNGSALSIDAHRLESDAIYSTGIRDDLATSRLNTRYDSPQTRDLRWSVAYQFLDNAGRFVDSRSDIGLADVRYQFARRWQSTGAMKYGRIDTESGGIPTRQDLADVRGGLRFQQDWTRSTLVAAYALGYSRSEFTNQPDRMEWNHSGDLSFRRDLNGSDEIFAQASYRRDDNDTTGVGFTRDEVRAGVGWEGDFRTASRLRASLDYRNSVYDTFQFGEQTSEEFGLQGSLTFPDGGIALQLATSEGISNFIPDPAAGPPFLPQPDLVNESNIASALIHWRFLRNLRFRLQSRYEDRSFTTIGQETILSYHPEIEYNLNTWLISAGYSHYERRNGTEFTDDTVQLKVSKRFF